MANIKNNKKSNTKAKKTNNLVKQTAKAKTNKRTVKTKIHKRAHLFHIFRDYNRTLVLGVFTFVITTLLLWMQFNTNIFYTSIMQMNKQNPFDGMIMPIEKIPDYTKYTFTERKQMTYGDYPVYDFVDTPVYNPDKLRVEFSNATKEEKLAKLFYTVSYLGDYKMSYLENTDGHPGIDMIVPVGTPIQAVANGVVLKAKTGYNGGAGNFVVIKHEEVSLDGETKTVYSIYEHLSEIFVEYNDIVDRGQIIGKSGNTGNSTAPHLHFQIDKEGAPYHPYWPKVWGQMDDVKEYTIHPINIIYTHENRTLIADKNYFLAKAEADKANEETEIIVENNTESTINTGETITGENTGEIVASAENNTVVKEEDNTTTEISEPEETIEESVIENKLSILSNKLVAYTGNPIVLTIKGENIKGDIELINEGAIGRFSKNILKAEDFVNGEAVVRFAPSEEGKAIIIAKDTDNNVQTEIDIKKDESQSLGLAKFGIEVDKELFVGQESVITIKLLNQNDKISVQTFAGEAKITVENATVIPDVITVSDFVQGKANVSIIPKEEGKINIEVKAGALIGKATSNIKETVKQSFPDVSVDSEHFLAIEWAKNNNIFSGFPDGTFGANKPVTRAQLVKIVLSAINEKEKSGENINFKDVVKDAWYRGWLEKAVDMKIINGFDDGTFRGDDSVKRDAAFKIILNTMNVKLNNGTVDFVDVGDNDWYKDFAITAKEKNLLDFQNNRFEASKDMSRGEVAEVLYRISKL